MKRLPTYRYALLVTLGLSAAFIGNGGLTPPTPAQADTPTTTPATPDILHAGEFGTSHWYIQRDPHYTPAAGTLHIGAGTFASLTNSQSAPPWTKYGNQVAKVSIDGPVTLGANSRELFGYLGYTKIEGLDKVDASHARSLEFAFFGAQDPHLDLRSWDVHNVTDTAFMFQQATSSTINLTGWQLPKLTYTSWMFAIEVHVHELDLSGFNLRHATVEHMLMITSGLNVLRLGPNSVLKGTGFREPVTMTDNPGYANYWQNIGTGTLTKPNGTHIYTSEQLIDHSTSTEPDVFVRPYGPGAPVTVRYVDQNDKDLAPADVLKGTFGDPFTATAKSFTGYTLKTTDGQPTGTFTENAQAVTYHYAVPDQNHQSLTGSDATITVGDATPTAATFNAKATDHAGHPLPVQVDLSAAKLTTPGTYAVTLTTTDHQTKTVHLTVKADGNSSSSSSDSSSSSSASSISATSSTSTGSSTTSTASTSSSTSSGDGDLIISGGSGDLAAFKGEAVYAKRAIRLYRHPTFKKSQTRATYAKVSRTKRPMFVVTGSAKSKHGALRFKVRDVNHHSKTAGKVGYITAKKSYVAGVYYQQTYRKLKVLNAHGINGYKTKRLTGKTHHYRKGQVLRIKRIEHYHLTTRYVLTNGRYVTANKKLIKTQGAAVKHPTRAASYALTMH